MLGLRKPSRAVTDEFRLTPMRDDERRLASYFEWMPSQTERDAATADQSRNQTTTYLPISRCNAASNKQTYWALDIPTSSIQSCKRGSQVDLITGFTVPARYPNPWPPLL